MCLQLIDMRHTLARGRWTDASALKVRLSQGALLLASGERKPQRFRETSFKRDLDGATSSNAHPPYAQADHGDGSPQAPLTVYTMRRRQICKVVQTKVNSMLRCRAEARDKIRAEGGGNWRVSAGPSGRLASQVTWVTGQA